MEDDVSRLVGIEGLVVTGVVNVREQLGLEVELTLGGGCCRWCGRGSLKVKDRPVVRVRDLPVAGRVTWLLWPKRRFYWNRCRRKRALTRCPPGSAGSSALAAAPRTWRSPAISGRRATRHLSRRRGVRANVHRDPPNAHMNTTRLIG